MLYTFLWVVFVLVCVALIAVILVQRGRGGGLIESLAGADSLFGTKTSSFLVKTTITLATLFFVLSLALAYLSKQRGQSITNRLLPAEQELMEDVGVVGEEEAAPAEEAATPAEAGSVGEQEERPVVPEAEPQQ